MQLVVESLRQEFSRFPGVAEELLNFARIALDNGQEHLAGVRDFQSAEELTHTTHWQCLCSLLLTNDDEWRSSINARVGFPAQTHRAAASQLKAVIQSLSPNVELLAALCKLRKLPPSTYSEEEWRTVRSIFIILRHAIAQLRVVFAEQDVIDFAEAGIAAHAALDSPNVLMRLDERVQHLLVDEFQDTSRPHFALLRAILADWQPGDGRTCFFVGDPMQSIYLFRDAESRLFHQVREDGMEIGEAHLPMTALQLSTNFRSIPAIVNPLNEVFDPCSKPMPGTMSSMPLPYRVRPAQIRTMRITAAMPCICMCRPSKKPVQSTEALDAAEADAMLDTIRPHLPAVQQAQRDDKKYRIAVLARAHPHLVEILARLRRENISFRGVKIDLLRDRPEILDLLSLFRALLHPVDRIAWLAVLRAPWCGLTLPALHAICGDAEDLERDRTIPALIRSHEFVSTRRVAGARSMYCPFWKRRRLPTPLELLQVHPPGCRFGSSVHGTHSGPHSF